MNYWFSLLISNLWVIAAFFSQTMAQVIFCIILSLMWIGIAVFNTNEVNDESCNQ